MSTRREFIETLSATAMLGTIPLGHVPGEVIPVPAQQGLFEVVDSLIDRVRKEK